ncbi:MAG: outer membrane beta-barrel protein [Bacteroidales bacterium]|nr:outer membrane beta-barrel protein [Bacteroidales bacterium]
MKTNTNIIKGKYIARFPYKMVFKSLILSILILTVFSEPLSAQETIKYTKPSWWFGAAGGANINYYRGTTQNLNSDLFVPKAFLHGQGVGLYIAPLIEYHRPDSRLGFMLQAGLDDRSGEFDQVITSCNCPADLDANLTYLTVEPSIRLAPFKSDFYLYAGPRFAYNMNKSFTYKLGINPIYPDQTPTDDVTGDYSNVNSTIISMQIGAGYDFPLSSQHKQSQWVLSPFASFHPYFGQDPRSVETWTMSTLRVGAAIKFGSGKPIQQTPEEENIIIPAQEPVVDAGSEVNFSVISPENIPAERRVRETFPILNYVFFDLESTEISDRYVLLKKIREAISGRQIGSVYA